MASHASLCWLLLDLTEFDRRERVLVMRLSDLGPGQFFEFKSPGYSFRKCMVVGIDSYGAVNFLHETAGGDRFLLNNLPSDYDPEVETDLSQDWHWSGNKYGYPR
jgi:hypothetical protein